MSNSVDRTKLTPPTVAKQWGVSADTVVGWIRSGQLKAIDVSSRPGVGRPRFRIDQADLIAFENSRAVHAPPLRPVRRRRTKEDSHIIRFF